MPNIVNKAIAQNRKKAFRPKKHKQLTEEWHERFKGWGEEVYYSNIQSRNNNIVARAISKFSKGLTHSIAMIYSENLRAEFTEEEWIKIVQSWNNYYGGSKTLDNTIKVLVIASADENGMNCFDFSAYQKRRLSIRRVSLPTELKVTVLKYLVSRIPVLYDYTGLVFWWLHKICTWFGFLDDPEADWCSESIYDAFKKAGIHISYYDNPSPADIEACAKFRIVYKNLTVEV